MARSFSRSILAMVLGLAIIPTMGCPSRTASQPPPVSSAPAELAGLRFFVVNATPEASRAAKEDVPGYTIGLRKSVQRTLVRAGYVVVVDPREPHDLQVRVDANWDLRAPAIASVTLARGDRVVDQLSGEVRVREDAELDETGVVSLVEAMGRSTKVRAFANEPRSPAMIAVPPESAIEPLD
jgi:hypothetical protein